MSVSRNEYRYTSRLLGNIFTELYKERLPVFFRSPVRVLGLSLVSVYDTYNLLKSHIILYNHSYDQRPRSTLMKG